MNSSVLVSAELFSRAAFFSCSSSYGSGSSVPRWKYLRVGEDNC